MDVMHSEMLAAARASLESMTRGAASYAELARLVESGGFVRAPWCGSPACEGRVKDETGAEIRVIPDGGAQGGACVACGKPSAGPAPLFARGY